MLMTDTVVISLWGYLSTTNVHDLEQCPGSLSQSDTSGATVSLTACATTTTTLTSSSLLVVLFSINGCKSLQSPRYVVASLRRLSSETHVFSTVAVLSRSLVWQQGDEVVDVGSGCCRKNK
jgi:hypothetical protein